MDELKALGDKAKDLLALRKEMKAVESSLERVKEAVVIQENLIKVELEKLGITRIKIGSMDIHARHSVRAYLVRDRSLETAMWLRARGHEAGKGKVVVDVNDIMQMEDVMKMIKLNLFDFPINGVVDIHWKTLQSMVNRIIEETGEVPPSELVTSVPQIKIEIMHSHENHIS